MDCFYECRNFEERRWEGLKVERERVSFGDELECSRGR